jgi:serine-type D-Ala-D-Ala carboxypeptidase/endopeptidase (penicillin-binding protein 4)
VTSRKVAKSQGRKGVVRTLFASLRLCVFVTCLVGCASTTTQLPELDTPPFHRAFWAVHVEEDDGTVLYSQNADKLMIPASNRKLSTAATVANCLGFDTRLATTIWRDGDDLVIAGDGDPSLGSWRYERDDDFRHAAAALRTHGLTRVRDIVIDVSAFDRVTIPPGWKVGYLGDPYAAPVDAIAWNENGAAGKSIPDPAGRAGEVMRDSLLFAGIEVTGAVRINTERRTWGEKLLEIPSPFVAQLLTTVLKNSHNLYAEMLLKRVGGGTYATAFAVDRAFLTSEVKLDGDSFRFSDGSGLAADNLTTAKATIRVLRWMNEPARRGMWWALLSQPANEGTLRRRLVALDQRVRGKTGTLSGVNALSGIIAMPDGRYRYFSVMVNHHAGDGDEAQKVIDRVVERFAGTAGRR